MRVRPGHDAQAVHEMRGDLRLHRRPPEIGELRVRQVRQQHVEPLAEPVGAEVVVAGGYTGGVEQLLSIDCHAARYPCETRPRWAA